jgi:tetratricopeptide (TPR) repeat protein
MENSLAQKAVTLALEGNWKEALSVNLQILSESPNDIDALNRSARCYAELGECDTAIKKSRKVLEIDPENSIAQKCLLKWKSVIPGKIHFQNVIGAELFLEESGKTRIVPLLNPGSLNVFANLDSGDEVKLFAHAHRVSITDDEGKYLGCLPDDLAARLRELIKKGVKYLVLIKSIDSKNISVFIREVENKTGITSFPPEKIDYVTFTPPELVHRDPPEMSIVEDVSEL